MIWFSVITKSRHLVTICRQSSSLVPIDQPTTCPQRDNRQRGESGVNPDKVTLSLSLPLLATSAQIEWNPDTHNQCLPPPRPLQQYFLSFSFSVVEFEVIMLTGIIMEFTGLFCPFILVPLLSFVWEIKKGVPCHLNIVPAQQLLIIICHKSKYAKFFIQCKQWRSIRTRSSNTKHLQTYLLTTEAYLELKFF